MIDKSVTILIVDNDEPLRWLLAKCLSCYYTCVTAGSVDEASEIFATTGFDLVITEIRLTGASGLELCQFVNRTSPDTAVLIMSSAGDVVRGLQSFVKGACDYILKPINLSLILESVERLLQRQRTASAVRTALTNPARTSRARPSIPRFLEERAAASERRDGEREMALEGDGALLAAGTRTANRRASVRVPYLCDVECHGLESGSLISRINDLSTGGVFIDVSNPLPVGSNLELRFKVPDKEIRVSGEVRYSVPRIGMGIHFLDLGAEERIAIQRVVEDLTKMHSHNYKEGFGARPIAFT